MPVSGRVRHGFVGLCSGGCCGRGLVCFGGAVQDMFVIPARHPVPRGWGFMSYTGCANGLCAGGCCLWSCYGLGLVCFVDFVRGPDRSGETVQVYLLLLARYLVPGW